MKNALTMKRWIRGHRQPMRLFIVKFMPLDATCLEGTSPLADSCYSAH